MGEIYYSVFGLMHYDKNIMNYGFERMIYEIPDNKSTVEEIVYEAGEGMFMRERLRMAGLKNIPQNKECSLSEFINCTVLKLISGVTDFENRVKGVILAHSLPIFEMWETPFLDNCLKNVLVNTGYKVAISGQPCAILHQALQMSLSWLSKEDENSGILLIGADQVASAKERLFFNSIMGDAVFAGFVSSAALNNTILSSITETEIIACEGEMSNPKDITEFTSKNPYLIRNCIENAILEAKISMGEVRYIIPHTPYRRIWDIVAKLMKLPREMFLDDYIGETGHLNSNDSFCNYVRACNEKRIKKDDIVILINPGFGGSRGCTIIKV